MSNTFLISDTHFYHDAPCTTFKRADGTPLRPFANGEEATEAMIERWNSVVKDCDKVYHLGDVIMPRNAKRLSEVMSRLRGTKVLIRGNHDTLKASQYLTWFKDIRGSHLLDNLVLTHIPVHEASLSRWRGNIHGHLHANNVMRVSGANTRGEVIYSIELKEEKYYNVSVEQINYTPIPFETVNKYFKDRGL